MHMRRRIHAYEEEDTYIPDARATAMHAYIYICIYTWIRAASP
jgi:hypothetical protein